MRAYNYMLCFPRPQRMQMQKKKATMAKDVGMQKVAIVIKKRQTARERQRDRERERERKRSDRKEEHREKRAKKKRGASCKASYGCF